jgi:hypothetical protein
LEKYFSPSAEEDTPEVVPNKVPKPSLLTTPPPVDLTFHLPAISQTEFSEAVA